MKMPEQIKMELELDTAEAQERLEALTILKKGPRTTEFWITVVVGVLAQIVTAYGLYKASEPIVAVGGIMTSVAAGAYSISRCKAKGGV